MYLFVFFNEFHTEHLSQKKVDLQLALSISAPFSLSSSYFRRIPLPALSAGKGVDNIVVEANDFNPNL